MGCYSQFTIRKVTKCLCSTDHWYQHLLCSAFFFSPLIGIATRKLVELFVWLLFSCLFGCLFVFCRPAGRSNKSSYHSVPVSVHNISEALHTCAVQNSDCVNKLSRYRPTGWTDYKVWGDDWQLGVLRELGSFQAVRVTTALYGFSQFQFAVQGGVLWGGVVVVVTTVVSWSDFLNGCTLSEFPSLSRKPTMQVIFYSLAGIPSPPPLFFFFFFLFYYPFPPVLAFHTRTERHFLSYLRKHTSYHMKQIEIIRIRVNANSCRIRILPW